jgi:sugar transferase EpsL
MKRVVDFGLTVVILAVLSSLLCLIAVLVAWTLGHPILFRQWRAGRNGVKFELLKFRTMTESRDANGYLLPDEQRLTRLGAFLRATSLDELPELINVLRGDMSLVGPRPLLLRYLERYTPEQMRRHKVRPGITGWAQVNGRNALSWEQKFELDVWYVDHRSVWLDLRILCLTAWRVLGQEGIAQDGHATMPEFIPDPPTAHPNPEIR